jgi:hypothetical protein
MAIAIKNNRSLLKLDFDPIVATPTYFNSIPTKNNIDRANNNNSFLSLSNLRRMTTGFSSFTSGPTLSSHQSAGGGTRELLEQKARWMNDIAAVCQRNILIYEEQLRLQQEVEDEQQRDNSTDADAIIEKLPVVKVDDVELKLITDSIDEFARAVSSASSDNQYTSAIDEGIDDVLQ